MLHYLLNTSAIWLLSLLCFDIFLRRRSLHGYNRFYLLFTLLLGCVLPLISWRYTGTIYHAATHTHAESITAARHAVTAIAVATQTSACKAISWLMPAWVAGMLVQACILAADILKLCRYRHSGKKYVQDGCTVTETGKAHAPFSFLNTLFVQSRQQYTADEWQMICCHERQHTRLAHLADLILLHLLKIVYWFHPLVYIYHRRLLLIHEYQADAAVVFQPKQYGRFLIEQSMMHTAPAITHALSSPLLKSRLRMMHRPTSSMPRAAMLIILPLALVCIGCFSQNSDKANAANKRKLMQTTILPTEEDKKEMMRQITLLAQTEMEWNTWYTHGLRPLLQKLDDGMYQIGPPTAFINKEGKFMPSGIMRIVKVNGITPVSASGTIRSSGIIAPALQQEIDTRIATLTAGCPAFEPLLVNGKAQPYEIGGLYYSVSAHKIMPVTAE